MINEHAPLAHIRRLLTALVAVLLVVSGMTLASTMPAQAADGDPFSATEPQVFVAQGIPTQLQRAVTDGTGAVSFVDEGPRSDVAYNALAYNTADNYLYAIVARDGRFPAGALIRIGEGGVATRVGTQTFGIGQSALQFVNAATFGPDGNLYAVSSNANQFSMFVIDPATGNLVSERTLESAPLTPDITFANGFFWGKTNAADTITRIDPATNEVRFIPAANIFATGNQVNAGAAWTFGNGNLGFSQNISGNVSQVRVVNPASALPTFELVARSTGPSNNDNDGAAAPGGPVDLGVVKTGPAVLTPGTITYTITVTNNGPARSSGYVLSDSVPAPLTNVATTSPGCTVAGNDVTCLGGVLAVGASITYTVTATVPADAANPVSNTATVFGNEEDLVLENNTSTTTATPPGAANPEITLVKRAGVPVDVNNDGATNAGDTIQYSFDVTNSGDVVLNPVTVNDPLAGAVTCPAGDLAPGATVTCEADAVYTVTQADVAAGEVENTATATGTPPGLPPVTSPPSTTDTPTGDPAAAPALTLVKTANPTAVGAAGATVTYSFLVTNTGNVTVTDVAIAETQFSGSGEMADITCPVTTLAPAADTTCTTTYTVTQEDIEAGQITNTATASGLDPNDDFVVSNPSSATVTATQTAAITLVKTANPTTVAAPGQTVTYSFLVTNTGNVPLTNPTVTETQFSGSGDMSAITCPAVTLAPTEDATCTATYQVTQADIDSGQITNTATATATPPAGVNAPVSEPSTAVVTADRVATLALVKSATPTTVGAAGATVSYSFLVTNTGNVTVNSLVITETQFSGSGDMSAVVCPVTTLAPAASTTCTATYAVTQADIDAGSVTNTATANGIDPNNDPVVSNPSSAAVTATQAPSIALVKTATPQTVAVAGDTITYNFQVTNTGNVTLSGVTVTETAFTGSGDMSAIVCPTEPLAPQGVIDCTATYVVTQEDVDQGSVLNSATVTGNPPTDPPVTSPPSTVTVPIPPAPELTLVKSVDPETVNDAGTTVTYSFNVTNTGNVTVTDLEVEETQFSGSGTISAITCPVATLAPLAATTCTATYEITQADADAGIVTNTAVANGVDPNGTDVESNESNATVTIPAAPELTLDKTATPTTVDAAGDTVSYSFLVTNTGNVTLSNITIDETAFSGTNPLPVAVCPEATLAPGASQTCTTTYVMTQADIDSGEVTNTAIATGTPPGSTVPVPSEPDDAVVTAEQLPAVDLVKSADVPDPKDIKLGQQVVYSFVVTNTGNVTLTDINVEETEFTGAGDLPTPTCSEAEAASLAPAAQVICTTTYTVTQDDVDAGSILNTAIAHGTPPRSDTPIDSPPSSTDLRSKPAPALQLVKTASEKKVTKVGQIVTYTFEVTNTGNVTIKDPKIVEGSFNGHGTLSDPVCPAEPKQLIPGQKIVCTASYTVVAADLTGSTLVNTATTTGTPPSGPPVTSPPSSAKVNVPGPQPLAATGGSFPWEIGAGALLMLIAGGVLVAVRRRKQDAS